MLVPNNADIERFVRWRFAPYRPGFILRVQLYGGRLGSGAIQYRIALSDVEVESEQISDAKHSHIRKQVGSLDGLVAALRILATKAASPAKQCHIAVAPALFEDAISINKSEVAFWLGFALDFDGKVGNQVGPVEGLQRLARSGMTPRAIVATGSAWINGHGPEPKLHALFSFAEPVPQDGIERAERLVKAFTAEMGADPACAEASHVPRLPGSVHPPDFDAQGGMICPASLAAIQFLGDGARA